jgi:hypothetical protein
METTRPYILITLVGEQPLPALLVGRHLQPDRTFLVCTDRTEGVARRLKSLVPQGELLRIDVAFRIDRVLAELADTPLPAGARVTFDGTGGTKPMSLALYNLAALSAASEADAEFVYLQTARGRSTLHTYHFPERGGLPEHHTAEPLRSDLLTLNLYLQAHLGGSTYSHPPTQQVPPSRLPSCRRWRASATKCGTASAHMVAASRSNSTPCFASAEPWGSRK